MTVIPQHPSQRLLPRPQHTLLLAALLTPLLGACQSPPGAAPADDTALMARIKAGIGEARCTADNQCRSLPIGEKLCGGPETHWAFSTTSPQAAQLPGWAAELNARAKQRNQASGMAGNCRFTPDPGAVCQAQRCVLAVPAGAPALAR